MRLFKKKKLFDRPSCPTSYRHPNKAPKRKHSCLTRLPGSPPSYRHAIVVQLVVPQLAWVLSSQSFLLPLYHPPSTSHPFSQFSEQVRHKDCLFTQRVQFPCSKGLDTQRYRSISMFWTTTATPAAITLGCCDVLKM